MPFGLPDISPGQQISPQGMPPPPMGGAMPPSPPQDQAGGQANLGLDFLVGLLAGAGLPVISRALRPGRTPGERMATGGEMNPRSMLDQVSSAVTGGGGGSPLGMPSLQDILPALAAKAGPGQQGMQIPPQMLAMLQGSGTPPQMPQLPGM